MPTLCLNSIVKNESKIITRMLSSVVDIIDTYCICDTGSTDNTIEIITEFFDSRNIKGKIIHEPFINFEHNRNVALNACHEMSDYILFMDADMILNVKSFTKDILADEHVYSILQGSDSFYYPNVRIIKNDAKSKYVGVTHEYIDCPPYQTMMTFNKSQIFITDIGDGGSKINKMERDINLLKGDLEKNENNPRTLFYLANSYYDTNKLDEAIPYYEKRIEVGGWDQEIWYSNYRLGDIYKRKNEPTKAVEYWMKGFDIFPSRLENMFKIINYYRNEGNHKRAYGYIKMINDILAQHKEHSNIRNNFLFMENDVYTHLIDYEYIVVAYYIGIKNVNFHIMSILQNASDEKIIRSVLHNIQYYPNTYKPINTLDFSRTVEDLVTIGGTNYMMRFTTSTPCIIKNPYSDGYIMNIRLHNYVLSDADGETVYTRMLPVNYDKELSSVVNMNHQIYLDDNFNITSTHITSLNSKPKLLIGVEDIRLFYSESEKAICYIGTSTHDTNDISIVSGKYENNILSDISCCTQNFKQTNCEKNWVFFNHNGNKRVVYNWAPLTIGEFDDNNELKIVFQQDTPKLFKYLRGSTCGVTYKDEIWFVCHSICYEKLRNYYDIIVVLDAETLQVKKTSPYFKYTSDRTQFTLGLIVTDEKVILSYSIRDKSTQLSVYEKRDFDNSMINFIFKD